MNVVQNALQSHHTGELPFAQTQGMSALETLAEVSRQRLDLNGQNTNLQAGSGGRRLSIASVGQPTGFSADDFLVEDDKRHAFEEATGFDASSKSDLAKLMLRV